MTVILVKRVGCMYNVNKSFLWTSMLLLFLKHLAIVFISLFIEAWS